MSKFVISHTVISNFIFNIYPFNTPPSEKFTIILLTNRYCGKNIVINATSTAKMAIKSKSLKNSSDVWRNNLLRISKSF